MQIVESNKKVYLWSLSLGVGLSLITFISNWLGLIHRGDSVTSFQLFDISFYYFTPLFSWILLTIVALHTVQFWKKSVKTNGRKVIILLCVILLLSPVVRMFDIVVDFGLKNLLGMIEISPFAVLQDVWLVVIFSSPAAAFKILVIVAVVYFFKRSEASMKPLMIKTSEGYHVIERDTIMYLQSDGNYLNLKAVNHEYRIRNTLKSLESDLGKDFYRIHKSVIINTQFIRQLKHWRNGEYLILMADAKPLTSSKSYKDSIDEIKNMLEAYNLPQGDPKSATVRPTMA